MWPRVCLTSDRGTQLNIHMNGDLEHGIAQALALGICVDEQDVTHTSYHKTEAEAVASLNEWMAKQEQNNGT